MSNNKMTMISTLALIYSAGLISGHYHGVAVTLSDSLIMTDKTFCVRPLNTQDLTSKK